MGGGNGPQAELIPEGTFLLRKCLLCIGRSLPITSTLLFVQCRAMHVPACIIFLPANLAPFVVRAATMVLI